eukprot:5303253-Amphidinium_carterae.2
MAIIPLQMYKLRSPAMPPLRQRPGTLQQEWRYRPPDQPPIEQTQGVPKFPTFPKRTTTIVQPPPGLQQPELPTAPQQPILPLQQIPKTTTQTPQQQVQVQQPPQQPPPQQSQVRRRITTKTTPSKNDLLATMETGHLSTNEDAEEKKLSMDNMILQDWYDNDNDDYNVYELKTAIKEEHDALQKTEVFTRVN